MMKREGRTRQVVKRLLASGMTTREIAETLGLSTQAVHYHVKALEGAKK